MKEDAQKRKFGVLMPVSALPSMEGIGTFGVQAYQFVDFLVSAGAHIWQVLPLVPTSYGDSPYQSYCSYALNYYFIDLATLVKEGLLLDEEVKGAELFHEKRRVDYGLQFTQKIVLLRKAFARFTQDGAFEEFVRGERYHDFALFMSLKCKFGYASWTDWAEPYRRYDENTGRRYIAENQAEYRFWLFTQYVFLRQWKALKGYANERGIEIMGDVPLYLSYDSVEMWKYGKEIFQVDEDRRFTLVAGVPPDAFTDEGQRWGNPLYDWEGMKSNGYAWWNERLHRSREIFDILRIDHFRGFDRYYAVPAEEETARNGHWEDGPKEELFVDKLDWKIVAEDLGVIDDGVRRLMKNVGYPGMKILEFAFDGNPENEHKPSNYTENFVCYTGTHDNMPLRQYVDDLSAEWLETFQEDVQAESEKLGIVALCEDSQSLCDSVIRLAFHSKANTVVLPLWDVFAMGGEARMNFPSVVSVGNWSFRFLEEEFDAATANRLKKLATQANR